MGEETHQIFFTGEATLQPANCIYKVSSDGRSGQKRTGKPGGLLNQPQQEVRERTQMKKTLLAFLCALFLTAGWANAQIVVRIGPPAPIVERQPPPPHEGWNWVHGYYRWDGNRHVWVPGEWREPPHPHAHWVDGRWVHRGGGYVWIEGHWR